MEHQKYSLYEQLWHYTTCYNIRPIVLRIFNICLFIEHIPNINFYEHFLHLQVYISAVIFEIFLMILFLTLSKVVVNIFPHHWKVFLYSVCLSVCPCSTLSTRALTRVNAFGFPCIWFTILWFTMACSLLNMKFIAFIIR